MASGKEDEIRQRAHQIWEREGRPDGMDKDHWTRAERELSGEIPADAPKQAGARKAAAGTVAKKANGAKPAARRPAAAPK
ncbi:MAG: DUF2934 domain-containing protein [Rhizobiales bacterium]|jgi:hypothetical protein|nr:DUF2934 domain-containing protein [Hyphomicrobiales bacterium]OJU37491.1 MAG: hypothetical protein BGN94_08830 [Rhizobiales bacterium 68-8]